MRLGINYKRLNCVAGVSLAISSQRCSLDYKHFETDMGITLSTGPVIRATIVQASSIFYDTPATLAKAERLVREAFRNGSQLMVFPEAFVGGYPRGSNFTDRTSEGRERFLDYHSSAITVPGPEVQRLATLAGEYKVYLVMGVVEKDGGTLYSTVLFFNPNGLLLGKHRKLMTSPLERLVWGYGDRSTIPVFQTLVGKIGSAISWESRMPLVRTALYAKGVELYCALHSDPSKTWQASATHIAAEGGCFVLFANQFCRRDDYPNPTKYIFSEEDDLKPDTVVCDGGSVIVSPDGAIMAGPNYTGEGLITAELDMRSIVKAKYDFDVVGHSSRPDMLNLVVNGGGPKQSLSPLQEAKEDQTPIKLRLDK